MFSAEDGAMGIINPAVEKYEGHFERTFPLFEYIYLTRSKRYDFSIDGAKKLVDLIEKCITLNEPVPIPKGYEERVY